MAVVWKEKKEKGEVDSSLRLVLFLGLVRRTSSRSRRAAGDTQIPSPEGRGNEDGVAIPPLEPGARDSGTPALDQPWKPRYLRQGPC